MNFKPLPPQQHQQFAQQTAPQPTYGLPQPVQSRQPPPPPPSPPQQTYGPPKQPLIHGAGCDGWKPIPNPHPIGNVLSDIASPHPHPGTITIQTQTIPLDPNPVPLTAEQSKNADNSYLPPPAANNLALADNINLSVQPLPANLQLPIGEASKFHDDSGLGLTNINVIHSEGIEVCIHKFLF